jgi:DNA-binding transcriptional regulator YdaS (Cro superfamily)
MTPRAFRAALSTIGWTQRGLADRLGVHETRVRRWVSGVYPIPENVAEWLQRLATEVEKHPLPIRWNDGPLARDRIENLT